MALKAVHKIDFRKILDSLVEALDKSVTIRTGAILFCFVIYSLISFDLINVALDDVYIPLRYVWNFLNGNGLTFNPGEYVEGYSNPTWVFLISLIARILNVNDKFTLIVVNRLVSFIVCFASYIYFCRTIQIYNKSYLIAIFYLLVLSSLYLLNIYAFLGMETSLVLLFISIFFYYFNKYLIEGSVLSLRISSLFLGMLSISRPEGIIYIAAFVLSFIIYDKYFQNLSLVSSMMRAFNASYVSLMLFALFLLFRIIYYGELLPNTAASKNYFDIETIMRGGQYILAGTFKGLGGFLALLIFAVNKDSFERNKHLFILITLFVLFQFAFIFYTGWDWMPGYRFILPLLPLIYFTMFFNFRLREKWVLAFLLLILVAQTYHQRHEMRTTGLLSGFKELRLVSIGYKDVSEYLDMVKKPDDLMLIQEAGYVPFATDIKTIDLCGLTDKHIASLHGPHFEVLDLDYCLVKRKPTLIVTFETDYDEKTKRYYSEKYFQSNSVLQSGYLLQNYEIIYYKYKIAVFSLIDRNIKQKDINY